MKNIIIILYLISSISLAQNSLNGTYCTSQLYSGQCITFKPDLSFTYSRSTCTGQTEGQGVYKIRKEKIVLDFKDIPKRKISTKKFDITEQSTRTDESPVIFVQIYRLKDSVNIYPTIFGYGIDHNQSEVDLQMYRNDTYKMCPEGQLDTIFIPEQIDTDSMTIPIPKYDRNAHLDIQIYLDENPNYYHYLSSKDKLTLRIKSITDHQFTLKAQKGNKAIQYIKKD